MKKERVNDGAYEKVIFTNQTGREFVVFVEKNSVVFHNPSFLLNGFPQIMVWSIIQNLDETLGGIEDFLTRFGENIYDEGDLRPANVDLIIAPFGKGSSWYFTNQK